jgi:ABC-type phosphate transport system substrate-binding protein
VKEGINAKIAVMASGQSIRIFLAGGIIFAGSDSPSAAGEIRAAPTGLVAFPVTAGAIAVA